MVDIPRVIFERNLSACGYKQAGADIGQKPFMDGHSLKTLCQRITGCQQKHPTVTINQSIF